MTNIPRAKICLIIVSVVALGLPGLCPAQPATIAVNSDANAASTDPQHPGSLDTPQQAFISSLANANQQDLIVIYGTGSGACTDIDPAIPAKIAPTLAPFTRAIATADFDAIKGGACGTFLGSVASARQIIDGLTRDQVVFQVATQLIPSSTVSHATAQATGDAVNSLLTDWASHMDDGLKGLADKQYTALCKDNSKCSEPQSGTNSETQSAQRPASPIRKIIGGVFMLIALVALASTIVFVVSRNNAKRQGNDALGNRNAALATLSFFGFIVAAAIGGWIGPGMSGSLSSSGGGMFTPKPKVISPKYLNDITMEAKEGSPYAQKLLDQANAQLANHTAVMDSAEPVAVTLHLRECLDNAYRAREAKLRILNTSDLSSQGAVQAYGVSQNTILSQYKEDLDLCNANCTGPDLSCK